MSRRAYRINHGRYGPLNASGRSEAMSFADPVILRSEKLLAARTPSIREVRYDLDVSLNATTPSKPIAFKTVICRSLPFSYAARILSPRSPWDTLMSFFVAPSPVNSERKSSSVISSSFVVRTADVRDLDALGGGHGDPVRIVSEDVVAGEGQVVPRHCDVRNFRRESVDDHVSALAEIGRPRPVRRGSGRNLEILITTRIVRTVHVADANGRWHRLYGARSGLGYRSSPPRAATVRTEMAARRNSREACMGLLDDRARTEHKPLATISTRETT